MLRPITLLIVGLPLVACSSNSGTGGLGTPVDPGANFATQGVDTNSPRDVEEDTSETPSIPDVSAAPDVSTDIGPAACEEGKACNDGDLCTKNDLCTAGVCAGVPTACEAPAAPCATATCVEGVCMESIDDGFCFIDDACWTEGQPNETEPCQRCIPVVSTTEWSNNDGATCGEGDADPCEPFTCQEGACVGTPMLCEEDDGNPCTAPTCVAGTCEQVQVSGDCDDGDPCTTGDVCDKGNCIGGAADCDDGLDCTTDACTAADCLYTVDDGFCAIDGACVAAGSLNPSNSCEVCDPTITTTDWYGLDGVECDDGNGCTGPDVCALGVCLAGPSGCADDGDPCTVPTCPGGGCELVSAENGTPCDDGNACTANDVCAEGVCMGDVTDCDDGLSCTTDSCGGNPCVHTVDDGFCAIDDTCVADGTANPDNPCEACDSANDTSTWTPLDGVACDDGNLCTGPDACVAGVCVSGSVPCPDDANPCTTPTCDNDTCDLSPVPNGILCDDGDACTLSDTCSNGLCVGGPPVDADSDGAVSVACGGDDCDDNQPAAYPTHPETCADAIDNDCDGDTDEDCDPVDPGCTYHADCYPEKLCGNWYTTGTNECSDPCAGDSDCSAGFICTKVPGSVNAGYCEPAIGIGGQDAPCVDGTQCGTGLCIDGFCAGGCLDDQHCTAPGHTCQMIGDLTIGYVGSACTADGTLKQPGASCTNDGVTWDALQCASGHCDLTAPINLPAVCSNVCTSQSDCTSGQVCGIVFHGALPYGNATNADALPYHPDYTLPTYDGIAGCYTTPFGTGFGADATPCTTNNQCQSGHCLPLIPGDNTRFCTRMCSLDSDCPNAGMQCKLDVVNLVSGWLETAGNQNTNAYSLVRICKFQ